MTKRKISTAASRLARALAWPLHVSFSHDLQLDPAEHLLSPGWGPSRYYVILKYFYNVMAQDRPKLTDKAGEDRRRTKKNTKILNR